jgi:hypothetical protein
MKQINDYPNYVIYENGTIYSKKRKKFLKQQLNHKGYPVLKLCNNGISKEFFVHRLIAQHYLPNPNNKPQVNHIDGIKTNNTISNLEWVTSKENINHSWVNGIRKSYPDVSRQNGLKSAKKLIDIKTKKVYNSIKEAAKDLNINYSNLRSTLSRNNKLCLKYL